MAVAKDPRDPDNRTVLENAFDRIRRSLWVLSSLSLLIPSVGQVLTFQVDFRNSTYQVQGSYTFASLLAQHASETLITSNSVNALQGISAPVNAGGVNSDYSILMAVDLNVLLSGTYTFQVGTNWGRGGASIVTDNSSGTIIDEFVTTNDIWWANNWNNPDVFTTTVNLLAGSSYNLAWLGFEGCCGGAATIRYSVDGGGYQTFDSGNGDVNFVNTPEPGVGMLLGLGLLGMAASRRRTR
jgi:hypothetical protein